MSALKQYTRAIKELERLSPGTTLYCLLSGIFNAVHPFVNIYFSAAIIETLSTTKDKKQLAVYVVTALCANVVLFFLKNTFTSVSARHYNEIFQREEEEVTKKLYSIGYEHLENHKFQEIVNNHEASREKTGSPLCCLASTVNSICVGVVTAICSLIMLFPLFKLSLQPGDGSFIQSPLFFFLLIAAIAVALVIILLLSRQSSKVWFRNHQKYMSIERIYRYYHDMLSDYKTGKEIRTFNEQEFIEQDAVEVLLTRGEAIQKRVARTAAGASSMLAVIGAVVGFGVYIFIGLKGLVGMFSIGALVRYAGTFLQMISGITAIANSLGTNERILPTLDYYFQILNTGVTEKSDNKNGKASRPCEVKPCVVEFRNVSFKYPESDKYALKNISIRLEKGEHLAVVGRNGSGKTTFIKLLCRLYNPQEGEILLDGVDIREYDKESYWKLLSVVFQDFEMFSLKAGENIAVGEDYDSDRVWKSLEKAGVKNRIERMPDGLDTYFYKDLDESGIEISGGEAQKLALARALYKDSPIIVLDEPTAALDPLAEYEIYSRFNSFVEDKTAIYISHRLSSCRFCELIAVFDKGELVQHGTHDELVKDENGKYFALWNAQAQYYLN